MKTEHMKVGQGGHSKGEGCLAPSKEKPGQGANKFAHSKKPLECVWLAHALFLCSSGLLGMAFILFARTDGGFEVGLWAEDATIDTIR
jgi:hypothetical protein